MENTLVEDAPWAWYIVRSSGIMALLFLYLTLLLGLAIKTPLVRDIIRPIYSLGAHCWLSSQVLFFALIHALALLFDKYLALNLGDIFIPFYSNFHTTLMTLGILSLYLIVIIVGTSHLKHLIAWKFWRGTHYLYIVLYPAILIHSFYLGTDLKSPILRTIFLIFGGALGVLLIIKLFSSNRFHRA